MICVNLLPRFSLFVNHYPIPLKHCADGGIAQQLFALALVEVVIDCLQCGLDLRVVRDDALFQLAHAVTPLSSASHAVGFPLSSTAVILAI